jgi:hypothetical protein
MRFELLVVATIQSLEEVIVGRHDVEIEESGAGGEGNKGGSAARMRENGSRLCPVPSIVEYIDRFFPREPSSPSC